MRLQQKRLLEAALLLVAALVCSSARACVPTPDCGIACGKALQPEARILCSSTLQAVEVARDVQQLR